MIHLLPERVCRLTTMLPMVAGAPPVLVTVMKPLTTRMPASVAPCVAVTVQVTILLAVSRVPLLARLHWVVLVCVNVALELESEIAALGPPPQASGGGEFDGAERGEPSEGDCERHSFHMT